MSALGTAMYVLNTIMFYSEVHHKLAYVWLTKAPSRKEVKHTIKYINTTSEMIGNTYGMYCAANRKENKEIPIKEPEKKYVNYKYKTMRFPYLYSFYDMIVIAREQKREQRREQMKKRMANTKFVSMNSKLLLKKAKWLTLDILDANIAKSTWHQTK
jgi:hypothetical protein